MEVSQGDFSIAAVYLCTCTVALVLQKCSLFLKKKKYEKTERISGLDQFQEKFKKE